MNRSGGVASVLVVLSVVACGSEGASEFGDPNADNGASNGSPNGSIGDLEEIGPTGTDSACVTEVANAELTPTNLIFMYDKSGSMGLPPSFDPALKWTPVGTGMKNFFADPYSKTVRASLQFFPIQDDTIQTACAAPYATPQVALAVATDPAFVTALDSMAPSGGTPTLPALEGALAYAKTVAATRPNDKTAVVLVSDGEPGFFDPDSQQVVSGCTNNDVAHVANAAAAALASDPKVPTYVIGVGPQLGALNQIAAAGGTTSAMMVDVSNPATTSSQIVSALGSIRQREVSCDFSIPPPPQGQELDTNAVNVVLKKADNTEQVLGYSKECTSADGWRYDNPAAPQRILLCASSCTAARESSAGKVSLAYGCKTRVALK